MAVEVGWDVRIRMPVPAKGPLDGYETAVGIGQRFLWREEVESRTLLSNRIVASCRHHDVSNVGVGPGHLVPEVGGAVRAGDVAAVGGATQRDRRASGDGAHHCLVGTRATPYIGVVPARYGEHRRCHLRRRRLSGRGDGGEPQGGEEYGRDGGQPPLEAERREQGKSGSGEGVHDDSSFLS